MKRKIWSDDGRERDAETDRMLLGSVVIFQILS